MIEPQVQQHGIKLIFLPCDNIGLACADRTRVKQVLLNLLSNAIKYNREQGLIEVKCTISTSERLRISIKDSGVGLSAEQITQLFQSFNRLGQENSIKQGTGIGLVVAKQLVELMDGSIGVTSTVGVGSEFWIELPRDITSQRIDGDTLLVKDAVLTQESAAPYTLLYVEDNFTNLMLVEHIIEPLPHLRMMSATNGKIGLALARAHLPAIILMDITLPDISGIDVLKILRQDPATMHIPIIALSANTMSDDIEQGLKVGFFRYLTKPIKVNELISTLNEALKFSETLLDHAPKREQA
jgi:CheY-like chemotaxis protein